MERANLIHRTGALLRTAMVVLTAIGIATVIRRMLMLKGVLPDVGFRGRPAFDSTFGLRPVFTFLHILAGAIFLVLGVVQFLPGIRQTRPGLFRRSRAGFLVTGYMVGLSAIALPFVLQPIGGINEAAAGILWNGVLAGFHPARYRCRSLDRSYPAGCRQMNVFLIRA